jgi:hypothetical protein
MWYAVALYSAVKKNQSVVKLKSELTGIRGMSTILTSVGGVTSAVCGGVFWVPYVLTGVDGGWFYPWFGLAGFVLGMLIILGGIFIIRGKSIVGGNLAIWCGIANMFSGGAVGALEVASSVLRFFGLSRLTVAVAGYVCVLTLAFFPIIGGVLGLMSRKNRNGDQ